MEKSHWNGKLWYAYGTSITSVKWGTYAPYLEKISGMKLKNCGIPGGGLTNLGGCSKGEVKAALMSLEDGKAEAELTKSCPARGLRTARLVTARVSLWVNGCRYELPCQIFTY